MNNKGSIGCTMRSRRILAAFLAVLAAGLAPSFDVRAIEMPARGGADRVSSMATGDETPAEIAPAMNLVIGKSTLLRLPGPIDRVSMGNPAVADVTLISSRELYLLGKSVGATNVILWRRGGGTTIIDVSVNIDASRLQSRINELLPDEKGIRVGAAADSVVLSGEVSSAEKAAEAVSIAEAFVRNLNRSLVLPVVAGGGQAAPGTTISVGTGTGPGGTVAAAGAHVVNMLRVSAPQQVMLEVKVAEVSKTLLDKLGSEFAMSRTNGNWTYSILNSLFTDSSGVVSAVKNSRNLIAIDAEKKDGLVKVLAEPNIIAVSGQEGSFLAGGKIFIPVARTNAVSGLATITLEEKEFGVGLKFTPTVLDGGRINLKVSPEVSELSQTGSPFTTIDGTTSILPSFTTRRAQTTVQLFDGQSFAIAGLIKNNATQTVRRFPILGELPVIGALFRSSEFQTDKTELMFVVTPRLVKPLAPNYALPTDRYVPPTRSEFFFEGKMEGDASKAAPPTGSEPPQLPPPAPATGGFDDGSTR